MTPDRPGFRSDIEGLRGIAILLVIAFHAGVSRLAGGFIGVDVFFVLSGYLITGLLAREVVDTGDVNLPEFYARRARRLLPAFLVVLLATVASALWLYAPIDTPQVASDARAVALHYGNVLFAQNAVNYHAASGNPFLHTWSLAVEEQFYVIWPLLFAFVGRLYVADDSGTPLAKRLMIAVAIAGAVSFAASIVVTNMSQPWAFFGMPTRIWEFALGGAAALAITDETVKRERPGLVLQLAGFAAIGVATLTYHEMLAYPGTAALLPAFGGLAVIVGGFHAPNSVVSRVLSHPVLQWFGRISYTWYLWHWPLVGIGAVIDWRIGVAGKLAWSAFALVLAVLTHRFVEEPFRKAASFRDTPHRLNMIAIGASLAAAAVAWGALLLSSRSATTPAQRPYLVARHDNMRHDCWGSTTTNATAPCIFGDVNATTSVVLMGDSHAEHWLPAMDKLGRERHWKIYAMVKPGCPVADVDLFHGRLKRAYTECSDWRREKLARILSLRPNLVMLSSYDHYVSADGGEWGVTPATWRDGLRRTYATLSAAGLTTVAMRDVPNVPFDVPSCLSRRASSAPFSQRCLYDLRSSLHRDAFIAQTDAARGLPNLALVNMTDRVCARSPCAVVQRGTVVYRDDDHLTATFSRAEADVLGDRIAAAVAGLRRGAQPTN